MIFGWCSCWRIFTCITYSTTDKNSQRSANNLLDYPRNATFQQRPFDTTRAGDTNKQERGNRSYARRTSFSNSSTMPFDKRFTWIDFIAYRRCCICNKNVSGDKTLFLCTKNSYWNRWTKLPCTAQLPPQHANCNKPPKSNREQRGTHSSGSRSPIKRSPRGRRSSRCRLPRDFTISCVKGCVLDCPSTADAVVCRFSADDWNFTDAALPEESHGRHRVWIFPCTNKKVHYCGNPLRRYITAGIY